MTKKHETGMISSFLFPTKKKFSLNNFECPPSYYESKLITYVCTIYFHHVFDTGVPPRCLFLPYRRSGKLRLDGAPCSGWGWVGDGERKKRKIAVFRCWWVSDHRSKNWCWWNSTYHFYLGIYRYFGTLLQITWRMGSQWMGVVIGVRITTPI